MSAFTVDERSPGQEICICMESSQTQQLRTNFKVRYLQMAGVQNKLFKDKAVWEKQFSEVTKEH
jgi:hypothetical protein